MVELTAKSKAKKISVLLVCPMATGQNRIHEQTWQSIQGLVWNQPLDLLFLRDDAPDSPHMTNLTGKMNRAREVFLHGDYDAMLVVESDMIVPPHALQRLSRVKADVAYGVYCSRRGTHRWLAYAALEEHGKGPVVTPVGWGKVTESNGVGFGCTLIRRNVLEALTFHEGPNGEGTDWNFAVDLVAGSYRQAHDFGVICGHILQADPLKILWPIENAPYYEITEPAREERKHLANNAHGGSYITRTALTSRSTGQTTPAGTIVHLSAAQAADFLQREIVDPYEGEP
jgi:hypothetical protein